MKFTLMYTMIALGVMMGLNTADEEGVDGTTLVTIGIAWPVILSGMVTEYLFKNTIKDRANEE